MQMLVYLVLAVIIYGVLADRTDRAIEREMRKRQPDSADLRLVEDFDARPDLGPWYGRLLRRPSQPPTTRTADPRAHAQGTMVVIRSPERPRA